MTIYIDTSLLMSLYSPDVNSAAAASIMRKSSGEHVITVLGELELLNAMQLRVFRKELSAREVQSALAAFAVDLENGVYKLRPLPEAVFDRAGDLSRRTTARLGTRTVDLLQVAAALELQADRIYSFDHQQRKLAHAVGLRLK